MNGTLNDGRIGREDFAATANRLGAGTGTFVAGTWRNAVRTDYIGHEIDRLFRAAKAARPMVVSVGRNLWETVDPGAEGLAEKSNIDRHLTVRCDPRDPSASRGLIYRVHPETILAEKMKGMDADYRVYHVFEPASVRGAFA